MDAHNAIVDFLGGCGKVLRDKLGAQGYTPVPGAVAKDL
jgi:hypothetical protein